MSNITPQSSIFLLVIALIFTRSCVESLVEAADFDKGSLPDRTDAYEPLQDDFFPEHQAPDHCEKSKGPDCQNIKSRNRKERNNANTEKNKRDVERSDH